MRVLILGLNYLPETTSIGPYTALLAEHLASRGHDVRVITGFPTAPEWRIWNGYRGKLWLREVINGVKILRTFLFVPKNPRHASKRILFDMSFSISSLIGGLLCRRCDVVIAISPPLQLGLTAYILSRFKRASFLFHIQDLVPDAAIATGMLSASSLPVALARKLERFIYKHSEAVGVICEGFRRNLLARGIPVEKIKFLPNYLDFGFMRTADRNNRFRRMLGLNEADFVVMYSGSIGLKQGLEIIVEAAARLQNFSHIKFLIIGDGPSLPSLKEKCSLLQLQNVIFRPIQPRDGLPEQLAAADLLLITQKKSVTDIVFPGKLLYYMAAQRPILAAVSSESTTGRFVSDHQVGLVIPPEDATALANTLQNLDPQVLETMGKNGRKVAKDFDKDLVLPSFAHVIEELGN